MKDVQSQNKEVTYDKLGNKCNLSGYNDGFA